MNEIELTLKDMWNIIWQRKKMIIRNTLIVSILVALISLLLPNWYKATSVLLPPSNNNMALNPMSILSTAGIGDFLGNAEDQNRILSILKSNTLLETIAKKFNFIKRYDTKNMEEAIKELSNNINVSVEEEMQIVVSFWDKDQEKVAEINNYIVNCLDSLNIELSTKKGKNNRIFIESRIENVMDSLKTIESKLTSFMEYEGVLSLTDQVRVGVEKAAEMKAQIMAKEIELAVARSTYDKNNIIVKQLVNEILNLKSKYAEFYKENPSDKILPNFSKVPEVSMKYAQLIRNIEYFVKLIEFLGPQYESAKIEEMKDIPTIQLLDRAVRPEKKDKPRRAKIVLIFFALSFVISTYVAYFQGRSTYGTQ